MTHQEINEKVRNISQEAITFIENKCRETFPQEYLGRSRVLLYSRILHFMYVQHFNIFMLLSQQVIDNQIKAVKEEVKAEEPEPELTCVECPSVKNCEFAYDSYNTNGDCLAEK